ncbi:MAG: hypothetical protein Q8S00_20570 [Deltaproteobacteria bacterium]|nr:hypothetical protein [Deltaproteobacteria bacterium]
MVWFGVMGRNHLLNMTGHVFSVVGYDKDPSKVEDMCRVNANSYQLMIPIACLFCFDASEKSFPDKLGGALA